MQGKHNYNRLNVAFFGSWIIINYTVGVAVSYSRNLLVCLKFCTRIVLVKNLYARLSKTVSLPVS